MPQYNGIMYRMGKGDSPFYPPAAEISTTDLDKFLNWVDNLTSLGWVTLEEITQFQNMLRSAARKRELDTNGVYVSVSRNGTKKITRQDFNAATLANKASGKGMSPMRKPIRDYRTGTSTNNGTVVGTRMGKDYGPAKPPKGGK